MKAFWQSRTIVFNVGVIVAFRILSHFRPEWSIDICGNPEMTLSVLALINVVLRLVTKTPIGSVLALFVLVGASGCSSLPQKLDTDIYYRRDLPFCVDGYGCFEGLTTLPRLSSYTFDIAPKGDADIDLLVVTTCHRNESYEKTASGWFVFQKKNRFRYVYSPNPLIEGDGDCALVFQTFEKEKGRHAWAVILFEHPKYQLQATLFCDGKTIAVNGVGGCQSKTGLRQGISFPEPIMIETDSPCAIPKKNGSFYEWPITYKQCRYTYRSASDKKLSLSTFGHKGELVREQK